jgi:hypothetical protein
MKKNSFLQDAGLIGGALFVGLLIIVGSSYLSQIETTGQAYTITLEDKMTVNEFLQGFLDDSSEHKIVLPDNADNTLIVATANFASRVKFTGETIFEHELHLLDRDDKKLLHLQYANDYNPESDYFYTNNHIYVWDYTYRGEEHNTLVYSADPEGLVNFMNLITDSIGVWYSWFDYDEMIVVYDEGHEIMHPYIRFYADSIDAFEFNDEMPILDSGYGLIKFLEPITVAGSRATTGKGLSDIITINENDIHIDTDGSPEFNVPVEITFLEARFNEGDDLNNLNIYDDNGVKIDVHIDSYTPLVFTVYPSDGGSN